jgi:serine/threonine protein kinase/predicted Zn-dependent protease
MAQPGPRPAQPVASIASLTGLTISRFRIGERLGGGGMGEVYRARDTKLGRTIALKRMAPALRDDPAARRRFLQEAERTSRLNDPHIAAIYDVLEQGQDILLIMEYVEGETLRQRLSRSLTLEQFLDIALQCAQALMAAHDHGIIHGDIKPENIMLTHFGQVKVLDLGLARHLPGSDRSSTMDRFTTLAGTPAYMAPELLREEIPDGRADLFSLGVVFYEALAGRNPFLTSTFIATSERILHLDPVPLSLCNSRVPPGLQAVVTRLLAKDPRQRFASAADLLSALQALQPESHSTSVRLTSIPLRRRRWPVYAAALFVLLTLAGAWRSPPVYRWLHPPVLQPRSSVLIADFDNPGREPVSEQALREALTISLQQSRYFNVLPRSRMYDALQRMQRRDVARIDETLAREICRRENVPLLLAGSIARMNGSFQITLRALDPARDQVLFAEQSRFAGQADLFAQMDALASRVRSRLGESLAGIRTNSRPLAQVTTHSLDALQLYSQATDLAAQGKPDEAPPLLRTALDLDPDFAMAHLRLGEYYGWIVGKNPQALAESARAYQLRQNVSERERLLIEAVYFETLENYERAGQSLQALVGLYPDDSDAHFQLARQYYNLGQLPAAIAELRRALQLNPESPPIHGRLALYLARNNQPQHALQAVDLARRRGLQSPYLTWSAGLAYLALGDPSRAREQFLLLSRGSETERQLGHLYLAVADLSQGKLQTAAQRLAAGINSAPTSSRTLHLLDLGLLGHIYLLQNNPQAASGMADQIFTSPAATLQTSDLTDAGLLFVEAGNLPRAHRVLRRLDLLRRQTPSAWNHSCFYSLQGAIALASGHPAQAIVSLQIAVSRYPHPQLHRNLARAYARLQDWPRAVEQWRLFLAGQGEILQNEFPPDLALAHLYLARAFRQLNDLSQARSQYQAFFNLWQQADDLPIRRLAAREYQQLSTS